MNRAFFKSAVACLLMLTAIPRGMSQEPKKIEGSLTVEKVAPPKPEQLKDAQKKVREVFATEYRAAKTSQAKWSLAGTLAAKAKDTEDDPESEYAFAMEAADLYVTVGDALSAFRVLDDLAETFDIPVIQAKLVLFKKAAKEAKAPAQKRVTALVGLKLAGDAALSEAYDVAKEVAGMSLTLARPSRDASAIQRATDQQAKYTESHKFWLTVVEARQKLTSDPADTAANETVGRYLCFVRQDWSAGLPFLKQAFDQELKVVAEMDLSASRDDAALAIADAWWNVSEHRKKEREQVLPRCAHWYEKAIPSLTGLPKANAEKRLQAAYEAISGRNFAKILGEPANGVQAPGVSDCSSGMVPAQMQAGFDFRKSWVLSLQLNTPNLDDGPHYAFGWADTRIGRDPLAVFFVGSILGFDVDDCQGGRRQGMRHPVTPQIIGKWIDVKVVHDSVSQELEFYVDNRLIQKDPLTIPPNIDQAMPVYLGGVDGGGYRFAGQVRSVWLGNIK